MKTVIYVLTLAVMLGAGVCRAQGVGYSGVAQLPQGISLLVTDKAPACSGGPAAIVLNQQGTKLDQTCNVQFTSAGVSALFPRAGKPIFLPKNQFRMLRPG
jgi:hypothetical protein